MIWFTSDTHFGHANVLKFTDRHELWGEDLCAMTRALVANINAVVAPTDELYHLGDFSFKMTAEEAGDAPASGPVVLRSIAAPLLAGWARCPIYSPSASAAAYDELADRLAELVEGRGDDWLVSFFGP